MVNTADPKMDGMDNVPERTHTSAMRRFARRGWAAGAALGLALGLSVVNASPASAYVGPNFLRNWETGRCLDSDAEGNVYTNPCQSGNPYQTWNISFLKHEAYDIVEIENLGTYRCLIVEVGNTPIPKLKTKYCKQYPFTGWEARGSSWDQVQLANKGVNGCVDSDYAGSAYLLECNGGGYQKWKLGY